ncbi:hypothetical protein CFC21_110631 [Triticum aestivum]|uniref:Uncharacterized protein n=2 Tax=Triticum aestivum TaxID=4565 RepID=A0A3B6TPV2_WHEAT|nr:uncharacterized protein LOC123167909 [Triticum aestivum]KAF7110540.1 hypothetical protein CFC21_110631 [Triticum aestivum]
MSVVAAAAAVGPAPVAPSPAAPYGMCGGGGGGARKRKDVVHYQEEEEEEEAAAAVQGGRLGGEGHGLFVLETVEEEEEREAEAENERSSIGPVSEGDEEEGEEVESARETPWQRRTKKTGGLASLDALDDALPIKRGLSGFFSGKSRSFANLQDVAVAGTTSSKDVLAKPENPFNKRRRILRCCSIRRVSSTSLTALPPFLPPEPSFNIGNDGVINGGSGGGSG